MDWRPFVGNVGVAQFEVGPEDALFQISEAADRQGVNGPVNGGHHTGQVQVQAAERREAALAHVRAVNGRVKRSHEVVRRGLELLFFVRADAARSVEDQHHVGFLNAGDLAVGVINVGVAVAVVVNAVVAVFGRVGVDVRVAITAVNRAAVRALNGKSIQVGVGALGDDCFQPAAGGAGKARRDPVGTVAGFKAVILRAAGGFVVRRLDRAVAAVGGVFQDAAGVAELVRAHPVAAVALLTGLVHNAVAAEWRGRDFFQDTAAGAGKATLHPGRHITFFFRLVDDAVAAVGAGFVGNGGNFNPDVAAVDPALGQDRAAVRPVLGNAAFDRRDFQVDGPDVRGVVRLLGEYAAAVLRAGGRAGVALVVARHADVAALGGFRPLGQVGAERPVAGGVVIGVVVVGLRVVALLIQAEDVRRELVVKRPVAVVALRPGLGFLLDDVLDAVNPVLVQKRLAQADGEVVLLVLAGKHRAEINLGGADRQGVFHFRDHVDYVALKGGEQRDGYE